MARTSEDPQILLKSALGDLRDRSIAAINSARLADAEDAVNLYRELMLEALDYFTHLEELVSPPPSTYRGVYGREMDWLEDDARSLIASAVGTEELETVYVVLSLPFDLFVEGVRRRNVSLMRSALTLYQACWSDGFGVLQRPLWFRLRDSILLQLENFGDLQIAPLRTEPDAPVKAMSAVLWWCLGSLAHQAVDNRQHEDLHAVVLAVQRVFSLYDDGSQSGPGQALARPRWMLVLGLSAYVLFLMNTARLDPSEGGGFLENVSISKSHHPDWEDYLTAITEGDSLFQWHFWETLLWEERGGIITFDDYLPLAFAYLQSREKASDHIVVDDFAAEQRFYVERVVNAFDELAIEPWDEWLGPLSKATEAKERAEALLRTLELRVEAGVIAKPLDPLRVDTFMDAAVAEWQAQKSVMPRIQSQILADDVDRSTLSSELRTLGLNRLVPKDYFAETHVIAEPKDLAQAFISALARGEKEFWLDALGRRVDQRLVEASEFRPRVVEVVAAMRKRGLQPAIVVFRDWQLLDTLRGEEVDYTQRFEEPRIDGAPITLSYENVPFSCIVADFATVGELLYSPMVPRRSGDRISDQGRVLIGVEAIGPELATELWHRNPALAVSEGNEPSSEDEAIHRLQQQVVVRILEEIAFRLGRSDAVEVFQLSPGSATS